MTVKKVQRLARLAIDCRRMLALCYHSMEVIVAQILVRDLEPATVKRLKEKARQHGRSLQAEAKAILQDAAAMFTMQEALANSKAWHRRLAGSRHSDSVELLREDRER